MSEAEFLAHKDLSSFGVVKLRVCKPAVESSVTSYRLCVNMQLAWKMSSLFFGSKSASVLSALVNDRGNNACIISPLIP